MQTLQACNHMHREADTILKAIAVASGTRGVLFHAISDGGPAGAILKGLTVAEGN